MTDIATTPRELLERMRANLAWLVDDGYRESNAIVDRSACHLRFDGPEARVHVTVDVGHRVIAMTLVPTGRSGPGPDVLEFLWARGMPVPRPAWSAGTMQAAVDEHAAALKLLRGTELAGHWARLERGLRERPPLRSAGSPLYRPGLSGEAVKTLLERARADLAWLAEDGYEEKETDRLRSSFALRFEGPHATVTLYLDTARREIDCRLARKDDWAGGWVCHTGGTWQPEISPRHSQT